MTTTATRRAALSCALLASTAFCGLTAAPARAQGGTPPAYRHLDANGVDLVRGDFILDLPEGSIGSGASALTLVRRGPGSQASQWDGLSFRKEPSGTISVALGTTSETFTYGGSGWTATGGTGSTLTGAATTYEYRAANGTTITFGNPSSSAHSGAPTNMCNGYETGSCALLPQSVTAPDGSSVALEWTLHERCEGSNFPPDYCDVYWRLESVSNSHGNQLSFTYASDSASPWNAPGLDWYRRTGAQFRNLNGGGPVQAQVGYAHPVSGVTDITDAGGRVWRVTSAANSLAVRRPGASADGLVVAYSGGTVSSVTRDGVVTNYARSVSGGTATTTVTDAANGQTVIVSDLAKGRPTSTTDPLGRSTSFLYDAYGRLTRTTRPEGDYVQLSYDGRGNVTETRAVAKPGSGVPDIVASASYAASCANPVTCNAPVSTTDARGQVTDYSYDPTHGGVLTVTAPPATGGVRPQTRYAYQLLHGEYRLTGTSACRTGASCAGTADEVKTAIGYDAVGNVTSMSSGSGDNALTATSTMSYDAVGNLVSVDGPLLGVADTTRYRYNAAREQVGVIGPDPDGTGPLKHRASRVTIDARGLVTKVETGTVNGQSDADWSAFAASQAVETGYDAHHRPVTSMLTAGGTTYSLAQTGYDALGRPECVAVRMNPAAFGSALSGACSLGVEGSFGPDRISRTFYDAAGQVTELRSGVGVLGDNQAGIVDVATTYTGNGQVQTLTDGENNRTTYAYDGFDRLQKTRYPVPAKGAGVSASDDPNAPGNDFEQLTYDQAGNVTKRRNRAGEEANYTFDALNRVTLKDLPGTEPDVNYAYDLTGNVTGASQPGHALTFTYDALGRQISETGPRGTVASQFDLAGRRTRLTWPDGYYVDYDRLVTGELSAVRENGATSGAGVLATFGYDPNTIAGQLGRRTSLSRGNATTTSYGYDPALPLASLAHVFPADASKNLTLGFFYNPAGQITQSTRSNDAYAWTFHGSGSTATTVNGLNQNSTVGAATVTHDAKGNMAADGQDRQFGYSSENLLTRNTQPSTGFFSDWFYDPLRRYDGSAADGSPDRYGWLWDGHDLIGEYGPAGVYRRYVHADGDEPLFQVNISGARTFFHADERGSVIAGSGGNGALAGINPYDEYGRGHPLGNYFRFQYAGQPLLIRGLQYHRARILDLEKGRFLQPDPIGYGGGLNMYGYVSADPINLIDPSGMREICWHEDASYGNMEEGFVVQSRKVCHTIADWAFDTPGLPVFWNGEGPAPTDHESPDGKRDCGQVPPAPPGVNINNIIKTGTALQKFGIANKLGVMYHDFRGKGIMDFKQINAKPGTRSPFEEFGNFAYGAFSYAIGLNRQLAQIGAGWAQINAHNKVEWGDWGSYFDRTDDNASIVQGRAFAQCMTGSSK